MKKESPISRALRSLDGLSMGDAFGQRFFGEPERVERRILERELPDGPWFWTDDTEMALAIVENLGAHGAIDRDLLAKMFARRWVREPNRGYGAGAHQLLAEIARGTSWREASRNLFEGMGSYGNGAAMRVGPIGAHFCDDLEAVVDNARASAEVTHAHPEGQVGAIAVALAAAYACRDERGDFFDFVLSRTPAGETRTMIEAASRIALDASVATAANALGTGAKVSSMDTVPFSLWCACRHFDDFEAAMWSTVSGLGDRDTTCAIVGSIVGLRAALPESWRELREPVEEDPVVARLAR